MCNYRCQCSKCLIVNLGLLASLLQDVFLKLMGENSTMGKNMDKREALVNAAKIYINEGKYEDELAKHIQHKSESQNDDHHSHLKSYLREALQPLFTSMGFTIKEYTTASKNIFLVCRRIEHQDNVTILSYGHGDVTLGQSDEWTFGEGPYQLFNDGEKLFGRGTADNKGQLLINLLALKLVLEKRGKLGFNSIWIIEMGEEIGSPGLEQFCIEYAETLMADVLIASDGPRLKHDVPLIFLGARGSLNFELAINLRKSAYHSGNAGGILSDPSIILAHAIAAITDNRGQICIPAWRPNSLTKNIKHMLKKLPVPSDVEICDWGELDLLPQERLYGWNSFAVLAMESGNSQQPINAIPGSAHAMCQLRFVVGTNVNDIIPALRRHLDEKGFGNVSIRKSEKSYFPATRSDPSNHWVQLVQKSLEKTYGEKIHISPNLGGSLPNHVFSETLNLPTIWIPHSYAGCNQHGPNEHILLSTVRQSMALMVGLYWDIAEKHEFAN